MEQLKYHDSMVLERTDDDTTDWQRYLEGEIRVHQFKMPGAATASLLDLGAGMVEEDVRRRARKTVGCH